MAEARTFRQRVAAWIAGRTPASKPTQQKRTYSAARPGRNTSGFASSGSSSADAELSTSLSRLRNASRQMVRDSAYGKRAKQVVVNNVVGSGIGMQAQVMTTRDALRQPVNDGIEEAWSEWSCADSCHTGGALHFGDFERACMGQVFEAGEVFVRLHFNRFGRSTIPLALELVEAERVPDSIVEPGAVTADGEVRMGIEVDRFGRPMAYWIRERHPGDIRARVGSSERYERVPADQVFHLKLTDRWPQTRGEPWMHAVLRKFDDLNELTGSELQAVRAASYYFATIETPDGQPDSLKSDEESTGQGVMDLEPLTVQGLAAGEKLHFHTPNRPNAQLDAFLRHIIREMAAGALCSYESLSRDYSQSNYSSSRLALLDDRDTWKTLQQWWIRSFRRPLHKLWMSQAVLARAIPAIPVAEYATDMNKFCKVLFKPRGWSWIDPTKEVEAYEKAVLAGFTTVTDVIAQTADGRDIEDVIRTRRRELDMFEEADIDVSTTYEDPAEVAAAKAKQPAEPGDGEMQDDTQDQPAPARARVRRIA